MKEFAISRHCPNCEAIIGQSMPLDFLDRPIMPHFACHSGDDGIAGSVIAQIFASETNKNYRAIQSQTANLLDRPIVFHFAQNSGDDGARGNMEPNQKQPIATERLPFVILEGIRKTVAEALKKNTKKESKE